MSFGIKHKWYFTLIFPEAFQLHLFCIVGSHIECNMNCSENAFYIDSISNLQVLHHIHILKKRLYIFIQSSLFYFVKLIGSDQYFIIPQNKLPNCKRNKCLSRSSCFSPLKATTFDHTVSLSFSCTLERDSICIILFCGV